MLVVAVVVPFPDKQSFNWRWYFLNKNWPVSARYQEKGGKVEESVENFWQRDASCKNVDPI